MIGVPTSMQTFSSQQLSLPDDALDLTSNNALVLSNNVLPPVFKDTHSRIQVVLFWMIILQYVWMESLSGQSLI